MPAQPELTSYQPNQFVTELTSGSMRQLSCLKLPPIPLEIEEDMVSSPIFYRM